MESVMLCKADDPIIQLHKEGIPPMEVGAIFMNNGNFSSESWVGSEQTFIVNFYLAFDFS